MRVSEPEIVILRDVLAEALTLEEMDDATSTLGRRRERISLAGNLNAIFRDVVIYYNNRHQIDKLLDVARSINPTNPDLYLFEQGVGRAAQWPEGVEDVAGIEALIRPHLPSFNAHDWLTSAAAAENCVCLVGGADGALGTGFLVGPGAVMTNYHVVRRFIDKKADPAELTFTFDFTFKGADGVVYGPALPEWLIDYSPLDDNDLIPLPGPVDVAADRLDYAVVRLAGRPGEAAVGGVKVTAASDRPRGWLAIPNKPYNFALRKALILFHHAEGEPLRLSIDTDSFVAANEPPTRIYHRSSTEGGSSGSPCFDMEWNLVALHQGFTRLGKERTNRAAPLAAVRKLLEQRGKLAAIAA